MTPLRLTVRFFFLTCRSCSISHPKIGIFFGRLCRCLPNTQSSFLTLLFSFLFLFLVRSSSHTPPSNDILFLPFSPQPSSPPSHLPPSHLTSSHSTLFFSASFSSPAPPPAAVVEGRRNFTFPSGALAKAFPSSNGRRSSRLEAGTPNGQSRGSA